MYQFSKIYPMVVILAINTMITVLQIVEIITNYVAAIGFGSSVIFAATTYPV